MMKRSVQKILSVLMSLCLLFGLCAGANAQTADFEALLPLMDLVATASWHSPNAPERVPGADGELSLSFIDAFFALGQKYGAEVGVTEGMLADTAAQADLLGKLFAAKVPQRLKQRAMLASSLCWSTAARMARAYRLSVNSTWLKSPCVK